MIITANNKGFAPMVVAVIIAALLAAGIAASFLIFGNKESGPQNSRQSQEILDESGNVVGETESVSEGELPPGAADAAVAFCRQKTAGCEQYEGWSLDMEVQLTNKETGALKYQKDFRKGGCEGTYAGETYPINIKGETFDYQGITYELTCSAACSHWKCGEEPEKRAVCPKGQFSDANACILSCADSGRCEAVTKIPGPKCWQCVPPPDVSLHVYDYGDGREYDCAKLGGAQCVLGSRGGDLIFVSRAGLSKELYPLTAGFSIVKGENNPGTYLGGGELIADINNQYCRRASADRLRCFEVIYSLKRGERGDGWKGDTRVYLKDKNGNALFENVSIVMKENPTP